MRGLHLTADLAGCANGTPALADTGALRALLHGAVRDAGLTAVGDCFHPFTAASGAPSGITGVLLLAESHVAVHTWPELAAVTLDVYVCNVGADNSAAARQLLGRLVDAFAPAHAERHAVQRGTLRPDGSSDG